MLFQKYVLPCKIEYLFLNMNDFNAQLCKSLDWFLYDNGLHHERVNESLICLVIVSTTIWESENKVSQNFSRILRF